MKPSVFNVWIYFRSFVIDRLRLSCFQESPESKRSKQSEDRVPDVAATEPIDNPAFSENNDEVSCFTTVFLSRFGILIIMSAKVLA